MTSVSPEIRWSVMSSGWIYAEFTFRGVVGTWAGVMKWPSFQEMAEWMTAHSFQRSTKRDTYYRRGRWAMTAEDMEAVQIPKYLVSIDKSLNGETVLTADSGRALLGYGRNTISIHFAQCIWTTGGLAALQAKQDRDE